jgi:hypothetical protein
MSRWRVAVPFSECYYYGRVMPLPALINRLLKLLKPTPTGAPQAPVAPLPDWPLPEPVMVLLLAQPAQLPLQCRGNSQGIQVFPYPFDMPEIADLVEHWRSPDAGAAPDCKYCEFIGQDRSVRYFSCRMLIDTLERVEDSAGKGMSRLRWIALDQFGYSDEATVLYRRFEEELGSTMTATGLARLLMRRRPQRSLQLIEEAQRQGITGAAMSACHARVLFACGQVSEGTMAAALALKQRPDPLWMPADHVRSWGLLHGAAAASVADPALRNKVLAAIQSLAEGAVSARQALACAGLYEVARDAAAAAHHAEVALHMAAGDDAASTGAGAMLQRNRALAAGEGGVVVESKSEDTLFGLAARAVFVAADDPAGEVVVMLGPVFEGPEISDVPAVRDYCRQMAEARDGSLVEADVVQTPAGGAIQMIYKKPAGNGFQFTGVHVAPLADATRISTVVASEQGMTGIREAVVTTHLLQEGQLTIETYKSSWARDPYDAFHEGSGRLPLRFLSDDVVYDRMFRGHPLSRVRRILYRVSEDDAAQPPSQGS